MKTAMEAADKQAEDIAARAGYIWCIAALNAGISPRTLNRINKMVPEVAEKYMEYRTDELADYVCYTKLNEAGVTSARMTETEL